MVVTNISRDIGIDKVAEEEKKLDGRRLGQVVGGSVVETERLLDERLPSGMEVVGETVEACYGAPVEWPSVWEVGGDTRGSEETEVACSMQTRIRESAELDGTQVVESRVI